MNDHTLARCEHRWATWKATRQHEEGRSTMRLVFDLVCVDQVQGWEAVEAEKTWKTAIRND